MLQAGSPARGSVRSPCNVLAVPSAGDPLSEPAAGPGGGTWAHGGSMAAWTRRSWRPSLQPEAMTRTRPMLCYQEEIDRLASPCIAQRKAEVDMDTIPRDQRLEIRARVNFALKYETLLSNGCTYCWMSNCMCHAVDRRLGCGAARIWVYFHFQELMRSSNSGKLICMSCVGARMCVQGIPESEDVFLRDIAANVNRTFVLFPAPGAEDAKNVLPKLDSGEIAAGPGSERPIVVLLDGTWTNVKQLAKRLPQGVRYVRVAPGSKSLFTSRSQGSQREDLGRVSTVEAFAALLRETSGGQSAVGDTLIELFKINDDTAQLQRGSFDSLPYGSWVKTKRPRRRRAKRRGLNCTQAPATAERAHPEPDRPKYALVPLLVGGDVD